MRPTRDGRSRPKGSKSFRLVAAQEDGPGRGQPQSETGPGGNREKLRRRKGQIPTQNLARNIHVKSQTDFARGPEGQPQVEGSGDRHPPKTGGTGSGRGSASVPTCACALSPPPQPPLPPITAPLTTRLLQGAERRLAASPGPRDGNTGRLLAEENPWLGRGRGRGNAALPDPPSPPPPPAVRRPGGFVARASLAAQPPPSPPPIHVRAAFSALCPPPAPCHWPAAEPLHPIGPTTSGEGVLPLLDAPPGLSARPESLRLRGV